MLPCILSSTYRHEHADYCTTAELDLCPSAQLSTCGIPQHYILYTCADMKAANNVDHLMRISWDWDWVGREGTRSTTWNGPGLP